MKLARIIVGAVAALALGAPGAIAAPKCSPFNDTAAQATTNALRQVPAKPSRVVTPPKAAPVIITPVARGAVWLPKIRG